MTNDLVALLERLEEERKRSEGELRQLNVAIEALSKVEERHTAPNGSGKRHLSAAARERIAAAQRARWAEERAKRAKAGRGPLNNDLR